MTEEQIFDELSRMGVATAEVEFSGGSDSGGVDRIVFHYEGEGKEPTEHKEGGHYHNLVDRLCGNANFQNPALKPVSKTIEHMSRPVYERYGGFNNEPYVSGTLIYDVKERTVSIDAQEDYTRTTHVEATLYENGERQEIDYPGSEYD